MKVCIVLEFNDKLKKDNTRVHSVHWQLDEYDALFQACETINSQQAFNESKGIKGKSYGCIKKTLKTNLKGIIK